MTTAASGYLAHDEIVIGCDFARDVIVEPIAGQTSAQVVTAMTGATAAAVVLDFDGTTVLATATVAVTAATRTLAISLTDTQTTALEAGEALWRVRITTATAAVWPVRMPPAQIRALP